MAPRLVICLVSMVMIAVAGLTASCLDSVAASQEIGEQTELRSQIGQGAVPVDSQFETSDKYSSTIPDAFSATSVRDVLFPLQAAMAQRRVEWLLETGAGPDAKNPFRRTPLQEAAMRGRTDSIRILLAAGADVNEGDLRGRTALHFAASQARLGGTRFLPDGEPLTFIKTLLLAGADADKRDKSGRTALHCVATQSGPRVCEVIDLLLEASADIEVRDSIGHTPLHAGCLYHWPETVKLLLAKGANVNAKTKDGRTPLMSTMSYEFTLGLRYRETDGTLLETVKMLLDAGADVNAKNGGGVTALGYALKCKRKMTDVVELLKARGAKE